MVHFWGWKRWKEIKREHESAEALKDFICSIVLGIFAIIFFILNIIQVLLKVFLHVLFKSVYLGRTVSFHSILYTYDCIFSRAYIESYTLEFIYPGQSSLNEQFFCHLLVKLVRTWHQLVSNPFFFNPVYYLTSLSGIRPRISDHYLVN